MKKAVFFIPVILTLLFYVFCGFVLYRKSKPKKEDHP